MDRTMLAVGGGILLVGGLASYFLQKQPPNGGCNQWANKTTCEKNGCFWWSDGTCRNYPEGGQVCGGGRNCEDALLGLTDCDEWNNLCQCQNIDGEWRWVLVEEDSWKCRSGEKHLECFPSINKIATCWEIPGSGNDTCPTYGFSERCSCAPPDLLCDVYHYCDQRPSIYRCILEAAGLNISADNSNWENCFWTENPYCSSCCDAWGKSGHTCDFDLGGEYAASSLAGQITYEWTTPVSGISTNIYGYLEGVGWTYLGHHAGIGEGPHELLMTFAKQGLSKLRFASCSTYFVNSKPKSFYGILS